MVVLLLMPGMGGMGGMRGGPFGGGASQPTEHTLAFSLEELYQGTTKRLKVSRMVTDPSGHSMRVQEPLDVVAKPGHKKGTKFTFPEKGTLQTPYYSASDANMHSPFACIPHSALAGDVKCSSKTLYHLTAHEAIQISSSSCKVEVSIFHEHHVCQSHR